MARDRSALTGLFRSDLAQAALGSVGTKKPGHNVARAALGGEGGIRTPGTLAGTSVFETDPIDHSGTSPVPRHRRLAEGRQR